jgi:diguanylate cyclase (GGDEF)-like protein/PAS domain S-box-containing protein
MSDESFVHPSGMNDFLTSDRDASPDSDRSPAEETREGGAAGEEWRRGILRSLDQVLLQYEACEAIPEGEANYRSFFDEAPVGLFQVSRTGWPLRLNQRMAQLQGYASAEQLLVEAATVRRQFLGSPQDRKRWREALSGKGVASGIEVELRCRDGARKWLLCHLRAVRDGQGRVLHYDGAAEDITARKLEAERMYFLAYYDAVTGLPNRTLFGEQLAGVVAEAQRRQRKGALLLLELNRFKILNDSLGSVFGDRLLQQMAERIRSAAGGQHQVARISGAEFSILLANVGSAAEVAAVAARVVAAVGAEFPFQGHSLNISCNAGISIFPQDGAEGEALLKKANVALYYAREEGPNHIGFFTEAMNVQLLEQLALENSLALALERNELFLEYQPQVNAETCRITGLEALLRWRHPQLGLVPPNRFIAVAEGNGLIARIGEWVLRTACALARQWQDAGLPAVPVAVNVSAVQFRQQGFGGLIRSILQESGLEARYLELELTESLLLSNADVVFSILRELRAMGVKLAIDDFGTGYSSLGYLRQFQVNRVKIDRSFVKDVAVNPDYAAITTAIISMAKALNLEVLAEGVENEDQVRFLRSLACDEFQGYYFGRPATADQIAAELRLGGGQSTAGFCK